MLKKICIMVWAALLALPLIWPLSAAPKARVLEVGPGKRYAKIEDAYTQVQDGDIIEVYPQKNHAPYAQTALQVYKKNLTIKGMGKAKVKISGKGYDYTGAGKVPRAVFQFNKGADGCRLENFEIFEAHNSDGNNGAAVRVERANNITISRCHFHHCDNGIMSNGDGTLQYARNLVLEHTEIDHNGSAKKKGYTHNLYLGGTSVLMRYCNFHHSLGGQNIKSRAHFNVVAFSFIHDSANREMDLVDAKGTTDVPGSHSVLAGNVIVKKSGMDGNRAVIHFGQDSGGDHTGTLYMVHNTIVQPYSSQVVDLSAPGAKAELYNNIIYNPTGQGKLVHASGGALYAGVTGSNNWLPSVYAGQKELGIDFKSGYLAKGKDMPSWKNPNQFDYRLTKRDVPIFNKGLPWKKFQLPEMPGVTKESKLPWPLDKAYLHHAEGQKRKVDKKPDLGAYEYK